MRHIEKYNKIITDNKSIIICVLLLVLGYILQSINTKVSMNVNDYGHVFLFLIACFITILGIIILINILFKKSRLFKGIGLMSIFYLGYHGFILTIFKNYAPTMLSNDLLTILTSFITLLILYPLAKLGLKYCPILVGKI